MARARGPGVGSRVAEERVAAVRPLSTRLLRSTARVGSNTLLSRILGFVRDIVLANFFGASVSPAADAFFVAFRIPNLMRRLFAEGAFSQAFVPVLSEYRTKHSHEEIRDLAAHVGGTLGGVLLLVSCVGVLAAPVLVMIFAPGFVGDAQKYALTVDMLRVTFPYILFISLTAFAGGILNTYGRFGVPAFTPVLLNLSLIAAAVVAAPYFERPVMALAWGVLVAGVVQLAFQLPFLRRLGLLIRPRLRGSHEGVKRIVRLIVPALFGVSVAQVNLLVDTLIASFLVTGSVSWLYYSDRMVEFPLGVFGVALGTVILPSLSQRHTEGSAEAFSDTLDWALRLTLVIAVPAAVGLALLAGPVLATLFQHGEFGAHDVRMAARSLVAFSIGLLGFVLVKVLAPGFFARQDVRTPVRIAAIAMVSNIALNAAFVFPLAHAGLALATSLSAYINAGLLYRGLRTAGMHRPRPGWRGFALRVGAANLAMAVVLLVGRGELALWLHAGLAERVGRLALLIGGGGLVYLLALAAMGLRPRALLSLGGK
jgi:putative peptidoglycan lipid II flippase